MKFLKNNLKVIIAFILGLILAGGIVYAATSAKQISYTTNKNAEIKNVEAALNDLYNIYNKENDKSLIMISNTDRISVTEGKRYIIFFTVTSDYTSQNYKPSIVSGCTIEKETGMMSNGWGKLAQNTNSYVVTATSNEIILTGNSAALNWNHIGYFEIN